MESLILYAARGAFQLHAFCFMPEHMHVLAEGTEDRRDLLELIRALKLRTAFACRRSHGRRLWEMSYYEHILRGSDSVEVVAT